MSDAATTTHLERIQLSTDRMVLRLTYSGGGTVEFTSDRPTGFTDRDVEYVRTNFTTRTGVPGQRNYARKASLGRLEILAQLHLGPPTWWKPQLGYDTPERGSRRVRAGWLRALAALTVTRTRT